MESPHRCQACAAVVVLDDTAVRRGVVLCLTCADGVDEDAFREWQDEQLEHAAPPASPWDDGDPPFE